MKLLKLKNIALLSLIEKKGKKVEFKDGFNIVIGDNDTGKSSLLQSIYYAFGAKTKMHPKWKNVNPIPIIDFEYESKFYTILRDRYRIIVFDKHQNILNCSDNITNDFAPFFSDFFNFKIELTTHSNKKLQATPAYCLLPFYIDQDLSWTKNWNSFQDLTQFKKWKNDIINFHAGTKPNEYYILKSEINKIKEEKKQVEEQNKIIQMIYDQSLDKFKEMDLNISLDDFKKEIIVLLDELNESKKSIDSKKENLKDLYNQRHVFEEQIIITERSLDEIKSDYDFCINKLESKVECPTCGAAYENSFAERFSIAKDEDTCLELIQELKSDLNDISMKINKAKENLFSDTNKSKTVEEILRTKRHQLTLKDLINYKGNQNLLDVLNNQLKELKLRLGEIIVKLRELNTKLKNIDSPKKKQRIVNYYRNLMTNYLEKLNVLNLSYESYKKLDAKIDESGSDLPRALLAYYFSILETMYQNSKTGTFFPIVIDAPKQQEQDSTNEKIILEFIRDSSPKDAQIILGIVDLDEVKFDANLIELKDKLHLLNSSDYNSCVSYYKSLISKVDENLKY